MNINPTDSMKNIDTSKAEEMPEDPKAREWLEKMLRLPWEDEEGNPKNGIHRKLPNWAIDIVSKSPVCEAPIPLEGPPGVTKKELVVSKLEKLSFLIALNLENNHEHS